MQFQNIELTKDQYKSLLKIVFLGQWMGTEHHLMLSKEFDVTEQYFLSFAKQFGCEDWVVYDQETKKYYPTQEMENELFPMIDEYNDFVFWNELINRLAERDLVEEIGQNEFEKLDYLQKYDKLQSYLDKYNNECELSGIDNLFLKLKRKTHKTQ